MGPRVTLVALSGTLLPDSTFSEIARDGATPEAHGQKADTMANEEQVALTFKDLTYSVDLGKKQGTKVILDGISGCFKPGRLTALFGASGCGKTSLMDVLARRKNTGTIEGEIRFAGAPCKKENIKHLCGYVEQCATS